MALKIRLARGGAKKRPYYRIVIADSRSPRDGKFIDRIGSYNPLLPKDHAERIIIDPVKARDWLAKGATPTDRVGRFMSQIHVKEMVPADAPDAAPRLTAVDEGTDGAAPLYGKWKPSNNPKRAEPGQKAKERVQEREEKEEARKAAEAEAAAAAAEAAAAPPAEEAPGEEASGDAGEEAPAES